MSPVLKFSNSQFGNPTIEMDLGKLFQREIDRERFENKWKQFYYSDKNNKTLFERRTTNTIIYKTERFIPENNKYGRIPLLIIAGNPASSSVSSGICFAYEGNMREHRFWSGLRNLEIFDYNSVLTDTIHDRNIVNERIKQVILNEEYNSQYSIGIDMYFTFPSTASKPPWSGVNGLFRLFGKNAMHIIENEEKKRLRNTIHQFLGADGMIITLQKNAYEGTKASFSENYSVELAKSGNLISKYIYNDKIYVIGSPPTRFFHSGSIIDKLKRTIQKVTTEKVSIGNMQS